MIVSVTGSIKCKCYSSNKMIQPAPDAYCWVKPNKWLHDFGPLHVVHSLRPKLDFIRTQYFLIMSSQGKIISLRDYSSHVGFIFS